jgi:4-hydroxy-2-oxoheptanedioate aldolase
VITGLKQRIQSGETLLGCWLTLGSSLTAELVGKAGFDWVLFDLEHGAGTEADLVPQLQALGATRAASLVRVESLATQRAQRALDLGAEGVMFPRVEDVEQATRAAAALRYQPEGGRGIARGTRATGFGAEFESYRADAGKGIVGVVQVEPETILHHIDDVAAVEGIDVLFVGPSDLSAALGVSGKLDHARFREALDLVSVAAGRAGKAAGVLLWGPEQLPEYLERGFRFFACGSDAAFVVQGARGVVERLRSLSAEPPRQSKGGDP